MRSSMKALVVGLFTTLIISQIMAQNSLTCVIYAEQNVNRRAAPATRFKIAGILTANQPATAVLQFTDPDGFIWWELSDKSWVRSDVVVEDKNCTDLPDRKEQTALTRTAHAALSAPTLTGGTPPANVVSTPAVPFETSFAATVTTNALSIRHGPDLRYVRGARHLKGDKLIVIGRTTDATWVRVRGIEVGWVSARSIKIDGNIKALPVTPFENKTEE